MKRPPHSANAINDLIQVARDLRDKDGGCPWDLEQTHASLARHLIEEASELVEVIEGGISAKTDTEFREELGDVLFQVVIHAQLAEEEGRFNFMDVARTVADKLIVRHPHVYGEVLAADSSEVLKNWEAIKSREREKKLAKSAPGASARPSYLDGVPGTLPALQKAARLGEKASRTGFDWPDIAAIREKVAEELAELDEAATQGPERTEEELGDLLFALAQYARRSGIDPEGALRKSCNKFERRFRHMESSAGPRIAQGETISADEWETLWLSAKQVF